MGRKVSKLLVVCLALLFAVSLLSINVFGAAPQVLKSLKGSDGTAQADMKITKVEAEGKMSFESDTKTSCAYDYNFIAADPNFVKEGDIFKVGLVVNVKDINPDGQNPGIFINPVYHTGDGKTVQYCDPIEMHGSFSGFEFEDFIGKKVVLVGAFSVPEGCNRIQMRVWVQDIAVDIYEVVFATNGYNFDKYKGFALVGEKTDLTIDPETEGNMVTEDNPSYKDSGATQVPKDTSKPSQSATATQAPSEAATTEAPATTTEAPAETTEAPVNSTAAPSASEEAPANTDNDKGNSTIIFVIIGVVVVAGAGAAAFIILKNKKKKSA